MFNNLTYRKKNKLLLIGAILLLFVVYSFSIKKTITAYQQCKAAESQIELATNAPQRAAALQKQLAQMDVKIGNFNKSGQNTEQALLELITHYCQQNHAILREFPKTIVNEQKDLLIETNLFVVEGNFPTLLNLVYLLEQKNKLGKIASVRYQLKKDFKTSAMTLTASIYLQNITHLR